MLKRNIKVTFRVTDKELANLKRNAKRCGYSQERYIRTLLRGFVPKEMPPLDYHKLMREVYNVLNILHNISDCATYFKHPLAQDYRESLERISNMLLEIHAAFLPEKTVSKNYPRRKTKWQKPT